MVETSSCPKVHASYNIITEGISDKTVTTQPADSDVAKAFIDTFMCVPFDPTVLAPWDLVVCRIALWDKAIDSAEIRAFYQYNYKSGVYRRSVVYKAGSLETLQKALDIYTQIPNKIKLVGLGAKLARYA